MTGHKTLYYLVQHSLYWYCIKNVVVKQKTIVINAYQLFSGAFLCSAASLCCASFTIKIVSTF